MTNFVFDLETNALELEDVNRITMFVYAFKKNGEWQTRSTTNYDEMRKFFNHKSIKAGHNILRYDLPVAKKILGIEYDYRDYVDTLGASWTLYPKRIEHGLGVWGKEFGVEKPHIENFENVSEEEIRHRCTEDVVINCKLVDKIEADLNNLYGNTHWHVYLRYLGFKLHNISLQREKPLKVDLVKLQSNLDELETNKNERLEELKPFLDPVPIYSVKKKPKVLYKKDGSLSVAGENWKEITDKYGVDIETEQEFKEIVGYKEPSAGSPSQIKNWLFSIGWKPKTFKEGRNEPVPQIKDGDELCESVLELAKQHPEVQLLDKIGILTHRIGLLKGFLENHKDGYIYQDIAGFTSTLRMRHKYLVNLPKPMMEFGQAARGVLTCDDGYVLCGSDLASLEDRIKQHLIFHLDPDYVKEMMSPDFDNHMSLAVFAKALTQDDADFYKSFKKQKKNSDFKYSKEEAERFDKIDKIRHTYKTSNYCLPTDTTEVLTRGGWKTYDQLSLDDLIYSYNTEGDFCEFVEIDSIPFFKNEDVINMSNKYWGFECTDNHRWFVDRRVNNKNSVYYKKEFVETKNISTECSIINAAPYKNESKYTTEDLYLLGWILSEGSIEWSNKFGGTSSSFGKKRGVRCTIPQSTKWDKHLIVEKALEACNLEYTKQKLRFDDLQTYNIKASSFRDYWDRLGLPQEQKLDVDYTELFMNCGSEQLEAYIKSFFEGDGYLSKNSMIISQNKGKILDGLLLALTLAGYKYTVSGKGKCLNVRIPKHRHTTGTRLKKTASRICDVFCVNNKNQTFIARQNGIVTITGNSLQFGVGIEKLSASTGLNKKQTQQLRDAYKRLNWSIDKVAESFEVRSFNGLSWVKNPINNFWYELRSEKDRFSAVVQGTGAFIFDLWVKEFHSQLPVSAQFHDEGLMITKEGTEEQAKAILQKSIETVNKKLKLNREMGIDVQFGKFYSEVH